ncbi:hypothetical protein [Conexibacter sp. CPCC 206217]|uniref:hypothetical protein n=1 Tax=Conexibacter sp. CPCC 206217 TaxID=3064574 RepID=UPI002723FF03|nr:hypothetical protein [Conexibacter sp. CPCC 206217]MDO8212316.1 hypothetical protein [Conexibacter sp. CPCC 206217]
MSLRTALAVGLAGLGLTAFTGVANADFTLSSGTLRLQDGSTTGTPPSSGSWVKLPTDDGTSYFDNAASTGASGEYTPINGSRSTGLQLGRAQPAGGIFGPLTAFGATRLTAADFDGLTVTGSTPRFTFTGDADDVVRRTLTAGDLSGLRISYPGGPYDVSTTEDGNLVRFPKHTAALTGSITGDATDRATITLDWTSDLTEPGFSGFRAQFHWVGTYTP